MRTSVGSMWCPSKPSTKPRKRRDCSKTTRKRMTKKFSMRPQPQSPLKRAEELARAAALRPAPTPGVTSPEVTSEPFPLPDQVSSPDHTSTHDRESGDDRPSPPGDWSQGGG